MARISFFPISLVLWIGHNRVRVWLDIGWSQVERVKSLGVIKTMGMKALETQCPYCRCL